VHGEAAADAVVDAPAESCALDLDTGEILAVAGGGGAHAAAAVEVSGIVRILHADADTGALSVSTRGSAGWATTPVLEGQARIEPSWFGRSIGLATLPDAGMVAVFFDADAQVLAAAFLGGGAWTRDTVDAKAMVGQDVSVAVAADGTVHVAYLDFGEMKLRHACGGLGAWQVEVADASGLGGNDPSIAISPDGEIHITYYHCGDLAATACLGRGHLRHSVRGEGGFTHETVDDVEDAGWYSSLAFDGAGRAIASYQAHATGALRLATLDGGTWSLVTIDPGPGAGAYSTLALVDGRPVVAYRGSGGGLSIAWRDAGGAWTVTAVAGPGDVSYPALAPIGDCSLLVAFRDGGLDALRVVEFPAGP
jgi:hypothetical protein